MTEPTPDPAETVQRFWRLMAGNDFHAVSAVLADDLVVDWPQSGERLRGPAAFARMNTAYPAHGPWTFRVNRLVAQGEHVVTQVSVSDGVQHAEPVSFFTVRGGRIVRLVEYWPERFPPAPDRAHLVEAIPAAERPVAFTAPGDRPAPPPEMPMPLTVTALVRAPLPTVWDAYVTPADIMRWNAASDDWHCPASVVDLRVGGVFRARMAARDGSMAFDFEGTYTAVEPLVRLAYRFGEREAEVLFEPGDGGVTVRVRFEPETTFPVEQQQAGWQAILDRFARHVEAGRPTA